MKKNQFDIIIIGAGVIGCLTARFLSQYKLKILLIEKEYDIKVPFPQSDIYILNHSYFKDSTALDLNIFANLNPMVTIKIRISPIIGKA